VEAWVEELFAAASGPVPENPTETPDEILRRVEMEPNPKPREAE
jgi:hypothetical protein